MKRLAPLVVAAVVYASVMFGVWQWSFAAGLWMFGLLCLVLLLVAEPQ